MSNENEGRLSLGLELSDKEIFHIGSIIAKWGSLEHEIFVQTLTTFEAAADGAVELPKEMQNLQFSSVLELWKKRVVDQAEGERGDVLKRQYERISAIREYRDALVHGMWEWSRDDLARISSIRIRKKQIITVHFTGADLEDLDLLLGKINFKVAYPGGVSDMVPESSDGAFSFVSRRFLAEVTNSDVARHWLGKRAILADDEAHKAEDEGA